MLAVQQPGLMLAPSVDASHSPNRPYEGKGCSIDSLSNRHKFKNVWPDPCFMGVFHCRWGFNRILHCHVKLLLVAASNYFINPGKKHCRAAIFRNPQSLLGDKMRSYAPCIWWVSCFACRTRLWSSQSWCLQQPEAPVVLPRWCECATGRCFIDFSSKAWTGFTISELPSYRVWGRVGLLQAPQSICIT